MYYNKSGVIRFSDISEDTLKRIIKILEEEGSKERVEMICGKNETEIVEVENNFWYEVVTDY